MGLGGRVLGQGPVAFPGRVTAVFHFSRAQNSTASQGLWSPAKASPGVDQGFLFVALWSYPRTLQPGPESHLEKEPKGSISRCPGPPPPALSILRLLARPSWKATREESPTPASSQALFNRLCIGNQKEEIGKNIIKHSFWLSTSMNTQEMPGTSCPSPRQGRGTP